MFRHHGFLTEAAGFLGIAARDTGTLPPSVRGAVGTCVKVRGVKRAINNRPGVDEGNTITEG